MKQGTKEQQDRIRACDDTPERAAVIANLEAGSYAREADIEADIADVEARDRARRGAAARPA